MLRREKESRRSGAADKSFLGRPVPSRREGRTGRAAGADAFGWVRRRGARPPARPRSAQRHRPSYAAWGDTPTPTLIVGRVCYSFDSVGRRSSSSANT
jgi:hypothetical protein